MPPFANHPNSCPAAVLSKKGNPPCDQESARQQRKSALRLRVYRAPEALPGSDVYLANSRNLAKNIFSSLQNLSNSRPISSASVIKAKENSRMRTETPYASNTSRRGDCGSIPQTCGSNDDFLFFRHVNNRQNASLKATAATAAPQLYFQKKATRLVIRRAPGNNEKAPLGCADRAPDVGAKPSET
jgi:hypothetical protein